MSIQESDPKRHLNIMLGSVPGVRTYRRLPASIDEGSALPAEAYDSLEPDLLEGESLLGRPVVETRESGFTHFMDGAQKVVAVADVWGRPVALAHLAAALCERKERQMQRPAPDRTREHLGFFLPAEVQEHAVDPVGLARNVFVPSEAGDSISQYRERLRTVVNGVRSDLELGLLQTFQDGVLLTDGNLPRDLGRNGYPFVVGLVKSHQKQYFRESASVQTVLGLAKGQRTGVFRISHKERSTAYSWYLRLHDPVGMSALYGLVRVEVPPEGRYVDRADEISAWLLAERAPTSHPDPRHDRLIYPIRWIEQYLRSRQISDAAIARMS